MRAVGIVAEYNPFHNGHAYQIAQAKKITNADAAVVVMSGNFVQRGLPAVFDKWQRTRLALVGGADLVYELPFAFAVQPAHLFARGAVELLVSAGVTNIAFGAEHAQLDFLALARTARQTLNRNEAFKNDYTQTYATVFNDVLADVTGKRLSTPNDLLGFAYAMAVLDLGYDDKVRLFPIQRKGASYHQTGITDTHIASATALRVLMEKKATLSEFANYVSEPAAQLLTAGDQTKSWDEAWYPFLQYKVLTTPVSQLEQIYQLNDGLAYRLNEQITRYTRVDYETFMTMFKSKRYTWARLQRTNLYTLLNVRHDEMMQALQHPYLRVLGATRQGRLFIKQTRDQVELPVINRVTHDMVTDILKLDYRAGKLYELMAKQPMQQAMDTGRIPVFYE
ncbi:nucleotidyltransferase [Weissella bombi]|uniref:tRNA(Met) cytidine acetate ligase n=1 Tax=Weissella bombi TaxID=1505725 RepID=A0A1C4AQH9_9LACO|nr:nucleotidyltransferase [Weissella bombi]SCB96853.1 Predicted nucleotidyltransferase [Weissella bombi]